MNLEEIFALAFALDASDLFLAGGKPPAIRRCGKVEVLHQEPLSPELAQTLLERILSQAQLERYKTTGSCDAAGIFAGRRCRFNFYNSLGAQAAVVRPLKDGNSLDLEALHLPATALREFVSAPHGLILIAGAAGSGKSTTLSAMLNYLNQTAAKHVVTVEDPVEYLHTDLKSIISQREITNDAVSFSDALRSAVRESPDVIVIGEMRDLDSMQIALSAALTGHLVISTIHTADAVQSLERIINIFPAERRSAVAADLSIALVGVIAQRLIPAADKARMYPAVELLGMTPMLRKLLAEQNLSAIEDAARHFVSPLFQTFNRALIRLLSEKKIRFEDALDQCGNRDEFILLARGMESGVDAFRTPLEQETAEDTPINMRKLLYQAVRHNASDLILSVNASPTLRINGDLAALDLPALTAADTQRLLFSMLSSRQRAEFESKREIDLAIAVNLNTAQSPQTVRFRFNGFYQRGSVGVAVRVIPDRIPAPEELGLPPSVISLAEKRQGLILITGPTGHGKSTTLASLIARINALRACHVITIEDPIEYVHRNQLAVVEQRELHADTLSFADALKYALRQDPDVILVGEMRDPETIAAALTAAETGHLVLATLHTNNAPQTIDRIVDAFPAHQQNQVRIQLAGTILAVVAQRLIPSADGKGRVAAFEIMTGTTAITALIRDGKTSQLQSVLETGYKDGMITMEHSLEALYSAGHIARSDYQSLTKSFRETKEY